MLSLAGIPPLGGFVGKTMLFGAALAAGWTWLAVVMAANVALSLYYYVRLLEPLYLRPGGGARLAPDGVLLRVALVALGAGTVVSGVLPEPWVQVAARASDMLGAALPR